MTFLKCNIQHFPDAILACTLFASVRIVDHGVKGVNPAPKMTQSSLNSSDVQDQFLSPSRLVWLNN